MISETKLSQKKSSATVKMFHKTMKNGKFCEKYHDEEWDLSSSV
jgi:hypothetical protein